MQKENYVIILLVIFLIPLTTASFTTTQTDVNTTFTQTSISGALDLYAYEINFNYTGTIDTVQNYNFLTECSPTTSGSSERDNTLSVYESCLDSSKIGTNGSGMIANITHEGTLSLCSTTAVHANGTTEYAYYGNCVATPPNIPNEDNTTTSSGGGGGSEGSSNETTPGLSPAGSNFTVDKDFIKVVIKQGETAKETITITNTGPSVIDFAIEPTLIERFVAIPEDRFFLEPGESKTININFFTRTDEIPEVYTGRIKVIGEEEIKFISVVIEVKELKPLFDVLVKLDETHLRPGDNVEASIELKNMGDLRNIDVLLYYAIKDFEGNIISYREESIAIEKALKLTRKLKIPENTLEGDYIFYVRNSHEDVMATGSEKFTVSGTAPFYKRKTVQTAALILGILAAILAIIAGIMAKTKRVKKK